MARTASGGSGRKRSTARSSKSSASRSRRSTAEQPTVEQSGEAIRATPPARVLRRSRDDRVIAGVAGGLARYLGVDPLVVRIAFVILAFPLPGLLLYILGWIFVPEEREGEPVGAPPPARTGERGVDLWIVVGVGLVALGTILLIDRLIPWFDRVIWPLVLIAIGAAVLVQGTRR